MKHLIINISPRYSKTELAVKLFIPWCMMKNPRCKFIHLSYSDGLALDNSNEAKEVVTSQEFQELWPHIKLKKSKQGKKAWENTFGGYLYAASAGGPVTGYGAGEVVTDEFCGAMIIDDPLKPDDANSDTLRKKVNDRWDSTIKSRFNSKDTPCIVIMQRIHENDFCGMLLEDGEYHFDTLILPAIMDEGTQNERPLWPAKHALEDLRAMERKNKYVFAAQYQQRPSPLGGGLIKGEWFTTYKVLPKLKYRAMFVDTAQKSKEYNDYQVAGIYGLGEDGYLYIIDFMREKFDAYLLEQKVPAFWEKHKADPNGNMRFMAVEDKVSGTTLIQKIRNEIRPKIPVREIQRNRDKLSRVMDIQGYLESKYVKVPESAPWKFDFIKECESFTPDDTHAHDDMVDTLCDAVEEMLHKKQTSIWNVL